MYLIKRNNGFSVIELAVTLALLAVFIAVGVPSFANLVRDNQMITETNLLVTSLNLARSEAIKRNARVSISNTSTTNHVWEDGWVIFTDDDGDGALDDDGDTNYCEPGVDDDCVLLVQTELSGDMTLRTGAGYTQYLTYLPTGFIEGTVSAIDTFVLCGSDADDTKSRTIALNATGRPATKKGNGICP